MQMLMRKAHLVLEDGAVFPGVAVGAPGIAAGEACFTTSMAGYEESVTDPSYIAQVLVFSYPLIGNYEIEESRLEADSVQCEAVVMRRARPRFSSWLKEHGVVALEEVDTRRLVRHIRDAGRPLRCALGEGEPDALLARALSEPPIDGRPLARHIGVDEPVHLGSGPRVALIDLGCKKSIPRRLAETGVEAVVVPGHWTADQIMELKPAAVLVGNGPGDPSALTGAIQTTRDLLGRTPVYGICLGHQLLGLALGLETYKLPFGHRGANHPVKDVDRGRVLVTVQNHGYAVKAEGSDVRVTHYSLNDGTVEGIAGPDFASVQFHPEAAPGPLDALPFFERIAERCRSART